MDETRPLGIEIIHKQSHALPTFKKLINLLFRKKPCPIQSKIHTEAHQRAWGKQLNIKVRLVCFLIRHQNVIKKTEILRYANPTKVCFETHWYCGLRTE